MKKNKFFILLIAGLFAVITILPAGAQDSLRGQRQINREREEISTRDMVAERIGASSARFRTDEIIVMEKGAGKFSRVRLSAGEDVGSALARFRGQKNIEYAEPNYIAYAFYTPNDPYLSYQWNLDNPTSGSIHAKDAWDVSQGNGVVVAVVDTGIAYENYSRYYQAPDLALTNFVPGYDFVYNDTHPNDDEGHGTHVAGTIAQSTNNGTGVAGVAFNASLMPVKVLNRYGSGSYADIADGIIWATDHGADVINLSLGGSSPATYLENALAYAYNQGVTIVAASGNNSSGSVSYPAAYDDYVIAVGATRYDETRAYYSNYGSSLDLVAPGGDLNVDQNGDGYGDGILQQTFGSSYYNFSYYFYQGTSMATPHVAGTAALIISAGIATTPDDVRNVLESTAKDLGTAGRDNYYGYGLIDAAAALGFSVTPNTAPVADAQGPYSGTEDIALTFNGSGSDLDGDVLSYSWDFGDGSSGAGVNPTHTYQSGGVFTVSLTVSDGRDQDTDQTTATITEVNDLPIITSSPVTAAVIDVLYTYDVEAYDPDGTVTEYSLDVYPDGMSINSGGGLIEWQPTAAQIGSHDIIVKVLDDQSGFITQSYTISVSDLPSEIEVFANSFESGLSPWTQDSQNDWFRSSQRSTNGSYSAEVDGRATDAELISPIIDLQGKTNATVSFDWYIESQLDNGEYLALDINMDNDGWSEYARLRGNADQENTWHSESINISSANTIQLRFRGRMSLSSEDANVDDVRVMAY